MAAVISAQIKQNAYDYAATNKGPSLKMGHDHELVDYAAQKILEEHGSPEAIVMDLKKKEAPPVKTAVSTHTRYNYISKGDIAGVGNTDLPREGKQTKRSYKRLQRANKYLGAPIITERPVDGTERSEPGPWGMDCIVSGKGKGLEALLTLKDWMTRESLVFKLSRQTNNEVLKVLNRLERPMGRVQFNERFQSITVDNGSEFLDWKALQKSVTGSKKPRTLGSFCHPYSSWERGTNEQNNGLIGTIFLREQLSKPTRKLRSVSYSNGGTTIQEEYGGIDGK
ncbi:Mobile element protein [Clostridiaceae bacterium JG1575]|nr:Mobile element protein [Clostridiaceae bacterium JG1575]